MPIRISKDPETFEVEALGAMFKFKQLSQFEIAIIDNRFRENGNIPKAFLPEYNLEMLKAGLIDWKDIVDKKTDEQIPFDSGLIVMLPMDVQTDLLIAMMKQMESLKTKKEKAEKNLKTTSGKGK